MTRVTAALALALFIAAPDPAAGPLVYVSNELDGTVSVIDASTDASAASMLRRKLPQKSSSHATLVPMFASRNQ